MKKFHILLSILVIGFIVLVILFKTYLFGGKHLVPYIAFIILFIVSLILFLANRNKKKILLISSAYLLSYIVINFFLFSFYHWPNHDKEIISVPKDYTSYNWQTDKPNFEDFDAVKLSNILDKAENINNLRSVLIVKEKKLVIEKYYHGSSTNDAFNMFIMTQSIISSLIGIAIDNNIIENENKKLIDYFPKYKSKDYVSDKADLTIEHLLTNTAGLDGDQNERSFKSLNWIESTLKRPKTKKTGENYLQQQTAHLLSGIITETSGKNTKGFAEKYLCKPLNIKIIDWFQSPEGVYRGSNAIYFTSRDLARFGDLYLSGGKLEGKQIISENWITKSLKAHSNVEFKINNNFNITGIGYSWLSGKIYHYDVFLVSDLGGQFIINIPSKNITIVTTTYKGHDYQLIEELICEIISTINKNGSL